MITGVDHQDNVFIRNCLPANTFIKSTICENEKIPGF